MATFYVDQTLGDDGDSGLSESRAWKTLAKIAAFGSGGGFLAGDFVMLKSGETWRETLTPPISGATGHQFTIGYYGTGAQPRILGSTAIATWKILVIGFLG